MVNASHILIAVLDKDGVFVEANPAMVESIGTNPVGKSLFDVFPRDVADRRMKLIRRVIESGKPVVDQHGRNFRHFLSHCHPIKVKGRDMCLVMAIEVTDLVRIRQLLSVLNRTCSHTLRERNVKKLLESVCDELYTVDWLRGVKIRVNFDSGDEISAKRGDFLSKKLYKLELRLADKPKGEIELYSDRELNAEEIDLLTAMANDLAFSIRLIEVTKQIERNISYFAFLVDGIRNPLAVIQLLAEVKVQNGDLRNSILKQVGRIVDVVSQLDKGWMESRESIK
jgi:PAS domain S-box-containing protein